MEGNHGEKRPAAQPTSLLEDVKALLVDVEGVTTPLAFVKEVLVPYAKENLKAFLEGNFEKDQIQVSIDALRRKELEDKKAGVESAAELPAKEAAKEEVIDAVVANVLPKLDNHLLSNDYSLRPLLELVWEDGYRTDRIQGEVYDDVVPLFQMLVSDDVKIFSCSSSDSKEAQKLLFGFSNQGDILEFLSGHFETIGEDKSDESFLGLAEKMGHPSSEILYLGHLLEGIRAAHSAGFRTCIVVRESNESSSVEEQLNDCNVVYSLEELWDEYGGQADAPLKRLHPDYFGEYSTDGATNDSEAVTGEEGEPEGVEPYAHEYEEPPEGANEEENGDSQDA